VTSGLIDALDSAIPDDVRTICQTLADGNCRCWVVGGSVRDVMLAARRGSSPAIGDWDLATDATPQRVQQLFRRVIPTGIQHGTVTVLMGQAGFEVTTLRGETTYSDGRRPDSVYFVDDIRADLARRDFTINAIAYDPLSRNLIDPFDGGKDLQALVLRAVGDPAERFAEDGLRVLRAARFAATLEVTLSPDTEAAIRPSLESYRKVSPERIRDEWFKALKARQPSRAFSVMQHNGLLAVTAPELEALVGCTQNRYHSHDVWVHTLLCLDGCPADPILRMAALLHDLGKPSTRAFDERKQDHTFYAHEQCGADMARRLLVRLKCSRDEQEAIESLVRHHLVVYDAAWTDAAVRRWLRRVGPERVASICLLAEADVRAKGRPVEDELASIDALRRRAAEIMRAGAALTVSSLAVDGHALMQSFGRPPGRWIGETLQALLDLVTEDPSQNTTERLLVAAKDFIASQEH
jgi:tRNA nucleotidyltransferase (CCA-adding enzyme)